MNMSGCISSPTLCDAFGRQMSYLRVSVTDRCNFRCRYCRDDFDSNVDHHDILRYEELESLLGLAVSLGVQKIRFTGGEPFVRKGFMDFLERMRSIHPEISLRVTSNGTMPADCITRLKALNIGVNLSLDTLRRDRFAEVTGVDALPVVRANIDRMLALGVPLKLNAVAMNGVNDDELPDFLRLAFTLPIEMRFIELMPVGSGSEQNNILFLAAADLQRKAEESYELLPIASKRTDRGPARVWRLKDADGNQSAGTFGLISSVTHNACASCNRMRLTSEGNLRPCLFDGREYRLKQILRHPKLGIDAVRTIWEKALARKPLGSVLLDDALKKETAVTQRRMVSIGG